MTSVVDATQYLPACPIDTWRTARIIALAAQAEEQRAVWAATSACREVALRLMTKKQREAAAPCPPADPYVMRDLMEAELAWWHALTKAKREVYREAIRPIGEPLVALREAARAAFAACKRLAAEVDTPVVGAGATWHRIETSWTSTYSSQTDSDGYARASAALRFRDLREIGYQVRGVKRKQDPARVARHRLGERSAFYHSLPCFNSYEVWVWTCEEGRLVAPYQTPARSLAEQLRLAADEGVNACALYGNLVPYALIEAAKADRPRGGCTAGVRDPIPWEVLEHDAELPAQVATPA